MARILLVDDEPDIRAMLKNALEQRGHIVDAAANATEALASADATSHEVAIIDYVLPGVRGLELLRRLRQKNPFVRSIIMSGLIDHDALSATELESQMKEQALADRYLTKPVHEDALFEAIDVLCTPLTGREINWKKLAEGAVSGRKVKVKSVREMERTLKKIRKKKHR